MTTSTTPTATLTTATMALTTSTGLSKSTPNWSLARERERQPSFKRLWVASAATFYGLLSGLLQCATDSTFGEIWCSSVIASRGRVKKFYFILAYHHGEIPLHCHPLNATLKSGEWAKPGPNMEQFYWLLPKGGHLIGQRWHDVGPLCQITFH